MRLRLRITWRNRKRWTRDQRVDRAFAGGLGMVAIGFGWVWAPLFLIVGGTLLATIAWKYGSAPPAAAAVEADDREDGD